MYAETLDKAVREAVEPLLEGMGYSLVDLSIGRLSGVTRVSVVVYRKEGVGVDDCAEVSGMLFPRLETIEGMADVEPRGELSRDRAGIRRRPGEYAIFAGRGVRVLAGTDTEWLGGIIDSAWRATRSGCGTGGRRNGFAISGHPEGATGSFSGG